MGKIGQPFQEKLGNLDNEEGIDRYGIEKLRLNRKNGLTIYFGNPYSLENETDMLPQSVNILCTCKRFHRMLFHLKAFL